MELSNQAARKGKDFHPIKYGLKPHTINEVGSTFSIQGFDLNYVGVIIGPSVVYRGRSDRPRQVQELQRQRNQPA